MLNRKRTYWMTTIALLLLIWAAAFLISPFNLQTNISNFGVIEKQSIEQKIRSLYDINFKFQKFTPKTANYYLPEYDTTTRESAIFFADLFGMTVEPLDFDEYFYFSDANANLSINKYLNLFEYKSKSLFKKGKTYDIIDDSRAIKYAIEFLKEKFLLADFKRTLVSFKDNIYTVKMIGMLGGMENHAFNSVVELDNFGNVLSFHYYNYDFEKITSVFIKSMDEAFLELPQATYFSEKIDLSSCKLVYSFYDSVVMPCYLFEGSTPNGDYFSCFVRAGTK